MLSLRSIRGHASLAFADRISTASLLLRSLRKARVQYSVSGGSPSPSASAPGVHDTTGNAVVARLAALRDRLEAENAAFENFAVLHEKPSAGCGSASPTPAQAPARAPKPAWLKIDTPTGVRRAIFDRLAASVKSSNLATVCEEAKCPNIGQCWGGKEGTATATIMLMGDTCTRGCSFCAVKTSRAPPPLDAAEPSRVADAVASWGVSYVVLTSVDRDDLADQGAGHFASTVAFIKARTPTLRVECLTPDFRGDATCVDAVARSGLDVFAHNVETPERLQSRVRDHRAGWAQSLRVLERAKATVPGLITKTSLMLGVGETAEDVRGALRGIRNAGIDVVTFGQYLRPSKRHMPVDRFVTPMEFDEWAAEARGLGFLGVFSGPLVRSSYKAGELFIEQVLVARQKPDAKQKPVVSAAARQ